MSHVVLLRKKQTKFGTTVTQVTLARPKCRWVEMSLGPLLHDTIQYETTPHDTTGRQKPILVHVRYYNTSTPRQNNLFLVKLIMSKAPGATKVSPRHDLADLVLPESFVPSVNEVVVGSGT